MENAFKGDEIMPLIPLKFPPGVFRNGTELDATGRWHDSNLCRWHDQTLKPIGGWRTRTEKAFDAPIRGMHSWKGNNGSRYLAFGNFKNIFVLFPSGDLYDITPSGFTTGRIDASGMTGFGSGFYNVGQWGSQPLSTSSTLLPATAIHFSTFGEQLVFCSRDDGRVYFWNLSTSNVAQEITGVSASPYTPNNTGCIVSDERFLFCFTSRQVKWSDQENINTWTSSATNQAGNLDLQTSGEFVLAEKIRGGILIVTNTDAHATRFIGLPFVHSIQRVGENCGAYGALSSASIDAGIVWWGDNGFFIFAGGRVQELKCEVQDYLTERLTTTQQSKICAVSNSKFDEVTWYFPGLNSNENNEYVTWNYKDNTWYFGHIGRTSGVDRGVFEYPIKATSKLNDSTYPLAIREGQSLFIEVEFNGQTPTTSSSPAKDLTCADVGNLIRQRNRINTLIFANPSISANAPPINFLDTASSINTGVNNYGELVQYSGSGTLYETFTLPSAEYFFYRYPSGSAVTVTIQLVGLDENGASQTASFQMVAPITVTTRLDGFQWTKITQINFSSTSSGSIAQFEFSLGGAFDDINTGVITESLSGRIQIGGSGSFTKFIKVTPQGRLDTLRPGRGWLTFHTSSGGDHTNGANTSELLQTQNKGTFSILPHQIVEHEVGFDRNSFIPFAETAPFQLGNGDQLMHVNQIIPDEKTQGSVTGRFKTKLYPNGAETDHGIVSFSNPTDVRFTGRQAKMRIVDNPVTATDWRVGTIRLNAKAGSKR